MNELQEFDGGYSESQAASGLAVGKLGMFLGMALGSGLGFLGGMLLGRRKGEARGLATGLELGRMEALATLPPSRTWRSLWRRQAAA